MTPDEIDKFLEAQSAMGWLFYQNRELYVQLLEDFNNMLQHEEARDMGCL
jgi:hypothetical protein